MERIHDLTDEQLIALTTEQIQRYIDVECLHKGIALLPAEHPVKPDAVKPEPDQTVYVVGNFEFETQEDAIAVLKVITAAKLVDRRYQTYGVETYYVVDEPYDHNRPTIQTKTGFSKEAWIEAQFQAKKYAEETSVYKELKKEYDDAVKGRDKVAEEVWTIVGEAREAADRRKRLTQEFERYIELADGNKTLAWKFFVQAKPEAEEIDGLQEELTTVQAK